MNIEKKIELMAGLFRSIGLVFLVGFLSIVGWINVNMPIDAQLRWAITGAILCAGMFVLCIIFFYGILNKYG